MATSKLQIKFKDAIDQISITEDEFKLLPICHNTVEGALFSILEVEEIEPCHCNDFNERLCYFFYGKPSYIMKGDLDILTDDLPITLIYNLNDISNEMYRVMPFDSGGFERYKLKKSFTQQHFAILKPSKEQLFKMVKSFFTTNENYMNNIPKPSISSAICNDCRPVHVYVDLIKRAVHKGGDFGEQALTFEIQYKDDNIPFSPKAIIVHRSFFSLDQWEDQIKKYEEHGIALHFYGTEGQGAMPLRKAYVEIEKKVNDIIKNLVNV